jgi:hypothetical protein
VTVTAKSGTESGTATFTWTVSPTPAVVVASPGAMSGSVGSRVSLTLHASGGTGSYTWTAAHLPTGLTMSSTTGTIAGPLAAAGTFPVTVTVRSGTQVGTVSFTWTVSPVSCVAAQILANAGFESGPVNWTASPGVLSSNADAPQAHGGSRYAWLDGYGVAHTDALTQAVSIPATCHSATLSFWLQVSTDETGTVAHDKLTVRAGSTILATYSNLDQGGYALRSFDLSAFVGKTVTISFTGSEDTAKATSFVLDDTALTVG